MIWRGLLKMLSTLLTPAVLTGCVTTSAFVHPPLPQQVDPVAIEWRIDTEGDKARVSLSWEDSQKLKIWLEDIKRYTLESKVIMCYYRKDLNEERCQKK